jgi:hypothetical protein
MIDVNPPAVVSMKQLDEQIIKLRAALDMLEEAQARLKELDQSD